jgi:pimeloyl-ACP methyl ester carboxylesterase
MPPAVDAPDTIVLVHGFWMTPRSWEHWIARYEAAGYRVLAPAYPGFEVEVEALNADPTPIVDVTVPQVIERYESVIRELDKPPIIIGHSAGGAFTQILLDHGCGGAGVALNSAPTEGVPVAPLSQLRSTFPVLKNPANRHRAVGFTHEQFHYAFTNGVDEELSRTLYERYAIPANGGILWNSVLANVQPGHQDTWVDYKNDDRAPLLFVSGTEDHIMPPAVQRSNLKHYKSDTVTEITEFEGPHFMVGLDGWEAIADHVLAWAVEAYTARATGAASGT